ncbi:MAG: Rieske 2Fe-2S domain-containing protein [bacterium]|nr:Rieske 2Fe-2S domain-containing protein [bacterium]MCY3653376.1 Rieske 2Fe-2S domain-containing protein [bacterium]MDE0644065.1 Rieske 2Fe-2S domain-containing protein [bacterium]MYF26875.1 Rieske 2Fe-2S domain-containing protein [Acidimicrobiia bacterium]
MTAVQLLIVALAVVVLMGVLGAFVIAYRRSETPAKPSRSWRSGVSRETRKADRSAPPGPVVVVPAPSEPAVEVSTPDDSETVSESEDEEVEEEAEESVAAMQAVEVMRVEELSPQEAGVNRRQFFTRALTTVFGAFLGLNGISYLAFLWPRLSGGFGSDIDVGAIADLRAEVVLNDGSILPKFVPEARAYIVPFAESDISRSQFEGLGVVAGGLTALFQRCVHLGCRVPWCDASQGFECPCHGSKYNLVGEYEAGPAPRNLDRFAVEDQNGRFIVKTGTIIQSARAIAKTVQYPQGPSCIALNAPEEV